jgi:chorismate mutase
MFNFSNKNSIQNKPFIISGPCSAESENQLVETAKQLAATQKVNLLRAGIWKPRTRPGLFEGMGIAALPWLQQAKQQTGLPTCVEVANASQVEAAIKYGVDVLWIGARTTVNPFSVQEVANALQGVDIPILIKNPVNPDIELWTGAYERIASAGITNIGFIHRGFSAYGYTQYRNNPMWNLAIEMRRRHPSHIFICDPSHIGGSREVLFELAQKSANLNYDGLMIESHINPNVALSDAKQQITPQNLALLLDKIIWRTEVPENESQENVLQNLRQQIDQLDEELLQTLSLRMKIADKIGLYKKENKITIFQAKRWNWVLEKALTQAENLQLSKEFLHKYFDAVHLESIDHQERV